MRNARNKVNRNKALNARRKLGQRDIRMACKNVGLKKTAFEIDRLPRDEINIIVILKINRESISYSAIRAFRGKRSLFSFACEDTIREITVSSWRKLGNLIDKGSWFARWETRRIVTKLRASSIIQPVVPCLLNKNTCRQQPTALPPLLHRHRSFHRWKLGESNRDVRPKLDSNHRRTADR